MNVENSIIARFQELIERGREVEKTKVGPPANYIGFDSLVDGQAAHQWRASSLSLLAKAMGSDSEHYRLFDQCFQKGVTYSPVHRGIGILSAAKEDLERGYLRDVRRLVAAETFSDFLDQAVELLSTGYCAPAAVIAGAVLEDHLRRLCEQQGISLPAKPKLDSMNAQLAKQGAINLLTQKRITAIADIRNSAAHGKWQAFERSDVDDMIKWIATFVEKSSG